VATVAELALKDGTVLVFGDNAPLQSIRDRFGNTITLVRTTGQTGKIDRIISPTGRWISLSYDASQRITQATDNIGRTVTYTYDSGRLWKVTDAAGGITEYTYDSSHRMLTIEDSRGITYLTNTYDSNGRVVVS
jgi:YD repeat-containing protein